MKKTTSITLVIALCLMAFGAPSCDKKKPSQDVATARAFVNAPIAFKAVKDISAVLVAEKSLTPAAKSKLDAVLDKAQRSVEQIAGDVQAKRFDPQAWDKSLQVVIDEFNALKPILLPNLDPRWAEWINLATYLIPQIKSIVDNLKPPAPPSLPIITAEGSRRAAITPGGIAAIAAISVEAAIKFISVSRETSIENLWQRFHDYSEAYHR